MNNYSGIEFRVVEPGTPIIDGDTGQTLKVYDHNVVAKQGIVWCTQKAFDAIRKMFDK